MTSRGPVLGVGIVGLGGASLAMLPKIAKNPGFTVAAVADIDQEILVRFAKDFPDAKTYTSAEEMSGDPSVHLVYIATPNSLHSEHARVALEQKRHVLIEKPMTVALRDSDVMIETADRNGVLLGVNVKHSFEARVKKLRDFVRSGELGRFRMMNSWRYADWLYRPRTPEELTPEPGGGILWRQGPHQFDILRTIGGGMVRSVKGLVSVWDTARRVPGSHVAYLDFEDGAVATAIFSGYDHFESRELVYGTGDVDPARHARARREHREAT
ncbi:MAG: Gfo/Idh/MocA family oxidoreductase, partial [Dehalococcoidia bacterium]